MPDLSNKATHQFWHDFPDPTIYQIVSFMESVENWTSDGDPELEKILSELGSALDNIGNIDIQDEEGNLIQTLSSLKMGRALRILQSIDTAHPGAASKILMHAEKSAKEDSSSGLFLRRNIVFERLRLLSRIFSENRLTTILRILNKE